MEGSKDGGSLFTQAQVDAIRKSQELLGEHFSAYTMIFKGEDEHDRQETIKVVYKGGYFESQGMIHEALNKIS